MSKTDFNYIRRYFAAAAIATATVCAAPSVAAAATATAPFSDKAVAIGLDQPTAVAQLPSRKLLVTQKGGAIVLVTGTKRKTLATVPVCSGGEMGLMGIALDPNFASNGFIYLYRTKAGSGGCATPTGRFNQVVRVKMTGETIDIASLTELVTGAGTDSGGHNAGGMRIGPDGKLYVSVGDTAIGDNQGGPGDSTNPYAQDLGSLNGKILRVNLDGSVPVDNPFAGTPGARGEIFAYGFRNPFRIGFDPQTGKLWVGDVGDFTVEEIDIMSSGGNYGWPHCEATLPAGCQQPGDIDPVFTYLHTGPTSLGSSIVGGAFSAAGYGSFEGDYFWADFILGRLYRSTPNPTRDGLTGSPATVVSGIGQFYGGPIDIVFGDDGALYYVQLNPGEIHRVIPPAFDELLAGKSLTLGATSATKKNVAALASDSGISLGAGPGSTDDPGAASSSVRLLGSGIDETYALSASGWSYSGKVGARTGLKYKAPSKSDPISGVTVKAGKTLKVTGKGGALGFSLPSDPQPVTVVLRTGTKHYCMEFGGTTKFTVNKKFQAKSAPAPAACP